MQVRNVCRQGVTFCQERITLTVTGKVSVRRLHGGVSVRFGVVDTGSVSVTGGGECESWFYRECWCRG